MMNFLKKWLGFGKKETNFEESEITDKDKESCPFCWGYEDYGDTSLNRHYNKQVDVKNHRDKHVKVGKFMVEHVEGFKNQTRVIERCHKCGRKKIRYKKK